MTTGTIVGIRKGHAFPIDLLAKIEEKHKTLCVFVTGDGGGVQQFPLTTKNVWKENIPQLLGSFKDSFCAFHFSDWDKPEDIQPFPLVCGTVGNKEQTLLSVLAEGDFPSFNKGGGHSNEYHLINEYLLEAVQSVYADSKENLKTSMAMFDAPMFHKIILGVLSPRGSILLIPYTGDPVLFAKGVFGDNGTGSHFSWGWVTNSYGYTEVKPVPVIEAPPTVLATSPVSDADRLKAFMNKGKPAESPASQTVLHLPPSVPEVKAASLYFMPKTLTDEKEQRKWQHQNIQQRYQFPVDKKGNKLWRNHTFGWESHMFKPESPFMAANGAIQKKEPPIEPPVRQTPDEPIPVSVPLVTGDPQPIIGPDAMVSLTKQLKGLPPITDPDQIQSLEDPFDTFSDRLQIDPDYMLFVPFAELARMNAYGVAVYAEELRRRIRKMDPTIEKKFLERTAPAPVTQTNEDKLKAFMNRKRA